jgi:hypothetical protein
VRHAYNESQKLRGSHYTAGAAAAVVLFCIFVAVELPAAGTPAKNLAVACLLTGAAAAVFGYVWPQPAWIWGALLSTGFTAFLLVVFGVFLWNGQIEVWPLADAALIAAVACAAAAGARRLRARRNTPGHA